MDYTRTITRTFEVADKAVLHVESRSGAVTVESHGSPSVIVEAVVHVWSEHPSEVDEAAALVERGMDQDDQQRVIIRAPSLPQSEGWSFWGKRGARVDYNIRVPSRTAVRVLSRSGRIGVARTEGRVHIESGSGRIHVEDIVGDVAVVSRSGSTSIDRVQGAVNAEARSGRLDVRNISSKVVVQSRSGAIDLREVGGDIEARGHTGPVQIENAHGGVYGRAHTGSVRYTGRIEGDLALSAHTGGITLAVDPANPFFLDAESERGTVRSELPPRSGAAASSAKSGFKVRLRTHTGSIRITRR